MEADGLLFCTFATLLTAGSMFILWIGDRISMKGIGNGVHDHCCRYHLQTAISVYNSMADTGDQSNSSATFNGILTFGLYIVSYLLIIVFVVFMQTAERKIPDSVYIQYCNDS